MCATLRSRVQDGTIELLGHRDSLRELRPFELENLQGGGIRIGHPWHGHDDFADAIALAVSEASQHVAAAWGGMAAGELEPVKLRGSHDRWSCRAIRPGWDERRFEWMFLGKGASMFIPNPEAGHG